MKRTLFSPILSLALLVSTALAQENTTINWTNFSFDATTQEAVLFRNAAGTPLSQGAANANTDGFLVQLGYYTAATTANNFAGTWVPITGFGAALHTSFGDSQNLSGSGAGVIDFVSLFNLNTTNVTVYPGSPANPGTYITQSSVAITTTTPPNNQILAIRFYDTASGTSGSYNAVSADNWLFQTPTTTGGGAIVNLFIADAFDDGPGGSMADLEFQASGPLNNFRTVILIPEPSTYMLLMVGLLGGIIAYRRRAKPVA